MELKRQVQKEVQSWNQIIQEKEMEETFPTESGEQKTQQCD